MKHFEKAVKKLRRSTEGTSGSHGDSELSFILPYRFVSLDSDFFFLQTSFSMAPENEPRNLLSEATASQVYAARFEHEFFGKKYPGLGLVHFGDDEKATAHLIHYEESGSDSPPAFTLRMDLKFLVDPANHLFVPDAVLLQDEMGAKDFNKIWQLSEEQRSKSKWSIHGTTPQQAWIKWLDQIASLFDEAAQSFLSHLDAASIHKRVEEYKLQFNGDNGN